MYEKWFDGGDDLGSAPIVYASAYTIYIYIYKFRYIKI